MSEYIPENRNSASAGPKLSARKQYFDFGSKAFKIGYLIINLPLPIYFLFSGSGPGYKYDLETLTLILPMVLIWAIPLWLFLSAERSEVQEDKGRAFAGGLAIGILVTFAQTFTAFMWAVIFGFTIGCSWFYHCIDL